jgi:hypothetical protein
MLDKNTKVDNLHYFSRYPLLCSDLADRHLRLDAPRSGESVVRVQSIESKLLKERTGDDGFEIGHPVRADRIQHLVALRICGPVIPSQKPRAGTRDGPGDIALADLIGPRTGGLHGASA